MLVFLVGCPSVANHQGKLWEFTNIVPLVMSKVWIWIPTIFGMIWHAGCAKKNNVANPSRPEKHLITITSVECPPSWRVWGKWKWKHRISTESQQFRLPTPAQMILLMEALRYPSWTLASLAPLYYSSPEIRRHKISDRWDIAHFGLLQCWKTS